MKTNLTSEAIHFISKQKLGFVATVRADGKPCLSHKGTLTVYDDKHLIFADIASPQTVENIRKTPEVVVEVVDYLSRKGYRLNGRGRIIPLEDGASYVSFYKEWGLQDPELRVRNFVLIEVDAYQPVFSPAYAWGSTESELRTRWSTYYNNLWKF